MHEIINTPHTFPEFAHIPQLAQDACDVSVARLVNSLLTDNVLYLNSSEEGAWIADFQMVIKNIYFGSASFIRIVSVGDRIKNRLSTRKFWINCSLLETSMLINFCLH
ncbi:hypothetical protein WI36_07895 [Burkholderia ubonensis]|nr:hypothetical protein WI37_19295 [Burkholderia ubonensis]KUZ79760.1 hypothetical protein WI36_07895 [Burkholderia ubonensis]KUZ99969.1 hypothetical protein WI40_10820 [Burkholderia ubonensis]